MFRIDKVTTPYLQCSTAMFLSLVASKFRIDFKICLRTYNTLCKEQPIYLQAVIATSLPSHSSDLTREALLSVPRVKTNAGMRAFCSGIPAM